MRVGAPLSILQRVPLRRVCACGPSIPPRQCMYGAPTHACARARVLITVCATRTCACPAPDTRAMQKYTHRCPGSPNSPRPPKAAQPRQIPAQNPKRSQRRPRSRRPWLRMTAKHAQPGSGLGPSQRCVRPTRLGPVAPGLGLIMATVPKHVGSVASL